MLPDLNQNRNVLENFLKNPPISNFMEILSAVLEPLRAYRRADGAILMGASQGSERV
jgi:hypothetical protein